MKTRILVTHQRYFGLHARMFRAGAERALARISGVPPENARFDLRSLREDFRVDGPASEALLRAFLTGGLLQSESAAGSYRPTTRFREYALARVVAPLSRARAKTLVEQAGALAARINADWKRNPFLIEMVVVSGSYMNRGDKLAELALWVVVQPRPRGASRQWRRSIGTTDGSRQIIAALRALSSFIVVRIVGDTGSLQRPFSVVFKTDAEAATRSAPPWERFREWSSSISRRFASK
ncbi:MAG TPA: hypothetical protein VGA51_19805 [Casimicrobiaceae bacterium]